MTLTVIIRTYGSSGVPCACPDGAPAVGRKRQRRSRRLPVWSDGGSDVCPGACPDGTPAVGRKRQRRSRRLPARKLRSNRRRPRHRIPPSEARRLLRLLWIKFQRCRLGRTLLHAFRNDYIKNIKKQARSPKEIVKIKPYQKYAYFAFPHAHVPYIIGEPPQNLV